MESCAVAATEMFTEHLKARDDARAQQGEGDRRPISPEQRSSLPPGYHAPLPGF